MSDSNDIGRGQIAPLFHHSEAAEETAPMSKPADITKTLDEHFRDWEHDIFGYGYGSGQPHTIRALKRFLSCCPMEGPYDYRQLEAELTPTVAWLLINLLCKRDLLEYGTSPRGAWLTPTGKALKQYVDGKSIDDLVDIVTNYTEDYVQCDSKACNCDLFGPTRLTCPNPFWITKYTWPHVDPLAAWTTKTE